MTTKIKITPHQGGQQMQATFANGESMTYGYFPDGAEVLSLTGKTGVQKIEARNQLLTCLRRDGFPPHAQRLQFLAKLAKDKASAMAMTDAVCGSLTNPEPLPKAYQRPPVATKGKVGQPKPAGSGVCGYVDALIRSGELDREKLVQAVLKRFPDRDAKKTSTTVGVRISQFKRCG